MATQNLTGVDALLKNVYRGPMVEQLNQETQMLDILRKTNANDVGTFTGRQIIVPVHSSRNRGRGGITDGGTLAVAGTQGSLDAIITMKYFNGGVELSDQSIKQSKTNEGAFLSALTLETEGCLTDMKKDITRVVFGTGDGLLATISGTPSGTSITVDTGQYIGVGDPIDIVVKTTGATGNGILASKVTAVVYTGAVANSATQTQATLTISPGSAGALDNTFGVYIAGDRSNESDGLQNILSTGRTLHQINSSTAGNAFWDSNTKDFAQSNPSEDGIMQLAQQCRQKSGKTPDLGILSLGGQRRLANTYTSERRLNDKDAITIDGGYEAIAVSAGGKAIPFMADVDCPAGKGFLINRSQFGWSQISDPDWLEPPDGKGSIFQLKSAGTGTWNRTWQAWLVWDAVLTNLAPNQSGKFLNINDDVPVVRS